MNFLRSRCALGYTFASFWAMAITSAPIQVDGLLPALADRVSVLTAELTSAEHSGEFATYATTATTLGKTLQAHNLHEGAIYYYEKALSRVTNPEWLYLLGVSQQEIGKLKDAIASYQKAIEIQPDQGMVLTRLGDAQLQSGDTLVALNTLSKARESKPQSAFVLMRLADAQSRTGQLEESLEVLQLAWSYQEAGQIAFRIARTLRSLDKSDLAAEWLVRRGPDLPSLDDPLLQEVASFNLNPGFFVGIAQRAWEAGDLQSVTANYQRAYSLDPKNVTIALDYANALIMAENYELAVDVAEKALETNPESFRGWVVKAKVLGGLGEVQSASLAAEYALNLREDESFRVWYANFLFNSGEFAQSATLFEQLLEQEPTHAYYLLGNAMVEFRAGNCEVARNLFDQALVQNAQWGEAHILRSRADCDV